MHNFVPSDGLLLKKNTIESFLNSAEAHIQSESEIQIRKFVSDDTQIQEIADIYTFGCEYLSQALESEKIGFNFSFRNLNLFIAQQKF